MADLIDRQKIKARFEPWLKVQGYSEGELNMLKAVLYEISVMPSVNAVKVVRCEQCKHYNSIDFHCYYHGSMCFKPNDYCTYGEVKND